MGLRQAIGRWIAGDEGRAPGPGADFWFQPVGVDTSSGTKITLGAVLHASAFFACIRFMSTTMGSLPLRMRERRASGDVDAPDHELDEIIRFQPNSRQTAIEFWETLFLHSMTRGCGYAEIIQQQGRITALVPLHASAVTTRQLRDGTLRFHYRGDQSGQERVLLQDEVLRVPGLSYNGVSGLSMIDVASEVLGLGIAADRYAGRVFRNNLNLGGYIKHPGKLGEDAQRNLLSALVEKLAGAENAHRPIILQEGMEFVQGQMTARNAQLLEARKWQIGEVARFYGIPLQYLGIYDGATHSNVEQSALDLVKYTIRPWVRRTEQAIRRDLIIEDRDRYYAEYNLEGLLRGDSETRASYFSAALGSGGTPPWMRVNEVRRIEGLPDDNELNAQTMPLNAQSADRLAPPVTSAIEDDTIRGRAERVVRIECAAARRAAMRLADDLDGMTRWAAAFYGNHAAKVGDLLGVSIDIARVYCSHQRDAMLVAVEADQLEALLEQWETSVADEIVRAFNSSEGELK